jgi:hypothetical protein
VNDNFVGVRGMRSIDISVMLDDMWKDYLLLNPKVCTIHQLLADKNDGNIVNDHIALRTFNHEKVNIAKLAEPFIQAGYFVAGDYHFEEKKLYAQHFQHSDPSLPKIFISELLVEKLSAFAQQTIEQLLVVLDDKKVDDPHFCYSGRPWDISYATYQKLLDESEYAAWMVAFGYRPNHFTVSLNHLSTYENLTELNHFLRENGVSLNTAGGEIKGSQSVFLEQSATLANKVEVHFSDQHASIPSCYYEFAQRYPLPDGSLYQGFVTTSADKIFESTDTKPSTPWMMLGV